jgi:hypothetical protein
VSEGRGFRAVDGMEGSGLDGRVCVWSEGRVCVWSEGRVCGRVRVVDGTEGSALGGRKGTGAGKEIVADRCGKSGRIWTDLEAL